MLACHVLGFVNHEGVGSAGVEQQYDRFLRGRPGVIQGRVDALRREIYTERVVADPGDPGHTIELTIDHHVQAVVERELDALVGDIEREGSVGDCPACAYRGDPGNGLASWIQSERVQPDVAG
jgi:cell division protein FtsI/penicillin-binding protein 2